MLVHGREEIAIITLMMCASCAGPDPLFADGGARDFQQPQPCLPNHNGEIEVGEVSFYAGAKASYRVNPPGSVVSVDLAGELLDDVLQWDLSSLSGSVFDVVLESPAGKWYAEHFPQESFTAAADATGKSLQVLRQKGDLLQLLGIVSKQAGQTLLVYDAPVALLRFPLRVGDSHVVEGTITDGRLNGLPIATRDRYEVQVDAEGTVRLPYLKISRALRVRVKTSTRAVGGASATTRQVQWFAECYGEVARAVSKTDEPAEDFSEAVELRRISF